MLFAIALVSSKHNVIQEVSLSSRRREKVLPQLVYFMWPKTDKNMILSGNVKVILDGFSSI